jgi:hypothetical protein
VRFMTSAHQSDSVGYEHISYLNRFVIFLTAAQIQTLYSYTTVQTPSERISPTAPHQSSFTTVVCWEDPGPFVLLRLKPLDVPSSESFELSEGPIGFRMMLAAGSDGLPFRSPPPRFGFTFPLSLTLLPLMLSPLNIRSRAAR